MKAFDEIIRSNTDWDGDVFKAWRESRGYTINRLAKKAKVSSRTISRIEANDVEYIWLGTMDNLRDAFNEIEHDDTAKKTSKRIPVIPPTKEELKSYGEYVGGTWNFYHLTKDASFQPKAVASTIKIEEKDGSCTYTNTALNLKYTGYVNFEGPYRFLIILKSEDEIKQSELLVIRFNLLVDRSALNFGGWLGIDQNHATCGSQTLLSMKKLPLKKALSKLRLHEDFWVPSNFDYADEDGILFEKTWNINTVTREIENCKDDGLIQAMSTYYEEHEKLIGAIRKRADRLRERSKGKSRVRKLNVKVLLKDYRPISNLQSRAKHREGVSAADMKKRIKHQLRDYLSLKKEYADVINLEVKLYEAWTFGKCIIIDKKAIYFSLIFAHLSAVLGNMLTTRDPKGSLWKNIQKDFDVIFAGGVDGEIAAKRKS